MPTTPKRTRAVKPKAEATPVAAVEEPCDCCSDIRRAEQELAHLEPTTTHRERMAAVDARAVETRKRVEAEFVEKGYGPKPRTSYRWIGRRTKGLPYSRMVIDHVSPGMNGLPGIIHAKHPTRKRPIKDLVATPEILQTFMPSLPPGLAGAMLGTN